jgi:ADP-ribosylglycohydrolase
MFHLGEHSSHVLTVRTQTNPDLTSTWTDDTSMTLCLAQSLIASNGNFVPQAAIRNYIKWYENGYLSATDECFDIGSGTRQALMIWGHYFDRSPDIREDDPSGHEAGQPEIDRALKREVST